MDTVFGPFVDWCHVKRVWARDGWHLGTRLLRTVLMHTVAVLLHVNLGPPRCPPALPPRCPPCPALPPARLVA